MTRNQLTYQQNLETERANRAREAENYRSNRAKEDETLRSNVNTESILQDKNDVKRQKNTIQARFNDEKIDVDRANAATSGFERVVKGITGLINTGANIAQTITGGNIL